MLYPVFRGPWFTHDRSLTHVLAVGLFAVNAISAVGFIQAPEHMGESFGELLFHDKKAGLTPRTPFRMERQQLLRQLLLERV